MTAAQTIQVRLSFLRENLNRLLSIETRSAEEQTEMETLTAEVSAKEPELRAALAAEDDKQEVLVEGDAETRELALLTERASVGAIILAVTEKRHSLGAELELQQAHGLTENQIPLDMLRVEQRAAGVTTARRTSEPTRRRSWLLSSRTARDRTWEFFARPYPQAMRSIRFWRLARMLVDLTATHRTYRKRTARSTPTSWPLSVSKLAPCTAALTRHDSPAWTRR